MGHSCRCLEKVTRFSGGQTPILPSSDPLLLWPGLSVQHLDSEQHGVVHVPEATAKHCSVSAIVPSVGSLGPKAPSFLSEQVRSEVWLISILSGMWRSV